MATSVKSREGATVQILDQTETEDIISNSIPFPIGGVMWWLKGETGVPALPPGFLECNGQVVNDVLSPMNGYTLPNINETPPTMAWLQAGLFIRGGNLPNLTPVQDKFQGHAHQARFDVDASATGAVGLKSPSGVAQTLSNVVGDPISDGVNDTPRVGLETAPAHLVLVAIVRVR